MNHKKTKIIKYGATAVLLYLVLMPSINALVIKEQTNNAIEHNIDKKNEKITGYGILKGYTYFQKGWGIYPLRFVRLKINCETLKYSTISGFSSNYYILLPLNQPTTITASRIGFESNHFTIMLTTENKIDERNIQLTPLH